MTGESHIVNEYKAQPFEYMEGDVICIITEDIKEVLFEYYIEMNSGKLYLRENGGECAGIIDYSCDDLRKIENAYKHSLEHEPKEPVEAIILDDENKDENLLEQILELDYDIKDLCKTVERINEKKIVSKEAVDLLLEKNLGFVCYKKNPTEMRYICELLEEAKIAVTDPLTKETKIAAYDPSDVLQEKKYKETWENYIDIVKEFNLQVV